MSSIAPQETPTTTERTKAPRVKERSRTMGRMAVIKGSTERRGIRNSKITPAHRMPKMNIESSSLPKKTSSSDESKNRTAIQAIVIGLG